MASGFKGALNRFLSRRLETILRIPGSKLYRKAVKQSMDCAATQRAVLAEILEYARDTEFGREHGFAAIADYEQFRRQVPVRDYEQHRAWIERHARGEEGVLFPGKPIMYNQTSGTTARPKLIPVTPYAFERTIKDRGKLWLYGLMRHYPGVFKGKDLSLVSSAVEGHTEDGTPYGSLSGMVYSNIPEFMKLVHTIPASAVNIADHRAKVYTMLRFGLGSDVSVMLTGNPSTVHNLVTNADAWKEDLIRDIRDGTLRADLALEPEIRAELEASLAPDPDRAAELVRLAGAHEVLRPAEYWPSLRLVHTWKNGNCATFIPRIRPWFREGTPILDFGYIASEIAATDLLDPETDGSILAVGNAFFEFVPLGQEDAEEPDVLQAHELEEGRAYFIYVTTLSGLYRYDMNDVVEVVGRFHTAPILRFLFTGKGITSITGEKLSEAQLDEAIRRALGEVGARVEFYIGYADVERQHYRLFIEFERGAAPGSNEDFAATVDRALCQVNVEYAAKRKSERLGPLALELAGERFFDRYRALRLAEGAPLGQFKWMQLCSGDTTLERLKRLTANPDPS